jgi:hypothetical protein
MEILIHQTPYLLRPVLACAMLRYLDSAPSMQRSDKHEKIAGAVPDILGVKALRHSRLGTYWKPRLSDKLLGAFIHANQRMRSVLDSLVDVQDILHLRYEFRVGFRRDAPLPLLPRLKLAFFKVFLIVS